MPVPVTRRWSGYHASQYLGDEAKSVGRGLNSEDMIDWLESIFRRREEDDDDSGLGDVSFNGEELVVSDEVRSFNVMPSDWVVADRDGHVDVYTDMEFRPRFAVRDGSTPQRRRN